MDHQNGRGHQPNGQSREATDSSFFRIETRSCVEVSVVVGRMADPNRAGRIVLYFYLEQGFTAVGVGALCYLDVPPNSAYHSSSGLGDSTQLAQLNQPQGVELENFPAFYCSLLCRFSLFRPRPSICPLFLWFLPPPCFRCLAASATTIFLFLLLHPLLLLAFFCIETRALQRYMQQITRNHRLNHYAEYTAQ